MSEVTYDVTGMTCGGCVNRVKQTLSPLADTVSVTLEPPEATLINPKAGINELNQALASVGHYQLVTQASNPALSIPDTGNQSWWTTYYPLLLIVGFIVMVSALAQVGNPSFDWSTWMRHFMAGFFIVFSFFKLLDIKSFANSYAMYDLLAMRCERYGLIYPFIELGLGIAYLINWQPFIINSLTLFIMLFSSIGVIRSVLDKQKIRCACLGSVFNLPMSTVTIVEDLSMALMAFWMLMH